MNKKSTIKSDLKSFLILFLLFNISIQQAQVLDPKQIRSYMFTTTITGIPNILKPTQIYQKSSGKLQMQKYTITMEKTLQQMLPQGFPKTPIYAYSGQTQNGKVSQFPGPTIYAKNSVPIKVLWVNNITGKHILPVDYSAPFINTSAFQNQVPTVPHAHGIATKSISDGQPNAYWTASGIRSQSYDTQESCQKNEAVFIYQNDQSPGLFWYHDHTYGITRLNVYAGLVGFYQIYDSNKTYQEKKLETIYGNDVQKKYFTITDKTFKTDGELYYPDEAQSKEYTSWISQVFGNTITVNGKVWPKINLQKKKHRLIFLNGCGSRYLNIYFLVQGKKIPFQLIRMQGDYLKVPVVTTQYFFSLGARVQIMLDLSKVSGQVIMKNNAAAPHPDGDDKNLIDQFTGTIMKIVTIPKCQKQILPVKFLNSILHTNIRRMINLLQENQKYPAFQQGQHVYVTLIQLRGDEQQSIGMYIDGVSMELGKDCTGSTFQNGKVYDFHFINLTPDTHPIHFHLVNMQKIKQYNINADQYRKDYYDLNGGIPSKGGFQKIPFSLNPQPYKVGQIKKPKQYQKIFRDILDVFAYSVTVMRIKFSHNDGRPFSFDATKGKYVYHCHMLQHQDNQMMRYFCLK